MHELYPAVASLVHGRMRHGPLGLEARCCLSIGLDVAPTTGFGSVVGRARRTARTCPWAQRGIAALRCSPAAHPRIPAGVIGLASPTFWPGERFLSPVTPGAPPRVYERPALVWEGEKRSEVGPAGAVLHVQDGQLGRL